MQKGQNMFKGEGVEDFQLALTLLDDIHVMRSKMFEFANVSDNLNQPQVKVPNYEGLIGNIRIGLRKSNYYHTPLVFKELSSMSGKPLNNALIDIYRVGVKARDSDIRKVIQHQDVKEGYQTRNKIVILQEQMTASRSEDLIIKDLKNDIKIMIELVEDPLVQLNLKSFYDENKTKGVEFLENMLHGLTSDDYTFLD